MRKKRGYFGQNPTKKCNPRNKSNSTNCGEDLGSWVFSFCHQEKYHFLLYSRDQKLLCHWNNLWRFLFDSFLEVEAPWNEILRLLPTTVEEMSWLPLPPFGLKSKYAKVKLSGAPPEKKRRMVFFCRRMTSGWAHIKDFKRKSELLSSVGGVIFCRRENIVIDRQFELFSLKFSHSVYYLLSLRYNTHTLTSFEYELTAICYMSVFTYRDREMVGREGGSRGERWGFRGGVGVDQTCKKGFFYKVYCFIVKGSKGIISLQERAPTDGNIYQTSSVCSWK